MYMAYIDSQQVCQLSLLQFSIIVIFSSTDKIFISTVNMCKFNNVFIMTLFINKNNNYVLNFIRQKSVCVIECEFFLVLVI